MDFKIIKNKDGWQASFPVGQLQIVFEGTDKQTLLEDIDQEIKTHQLANQLVKVNHQDLGSAFISHALGEKVEEQTKSLYQYVLAFGGSNV